MMHHGRGHECSNCRAADRREDKLLEESRREYERKRR